MSRANVTERRGQQQAKGKLTSAISLNVIGGADCGRLERV